MTELEGIANFLKLRIDEDVETAIRTEYETEQYLFSPEHIIEESITKKLIIQRLNSWYNMVETPDNVKLDILGIFKAMALNYSLHEDYNYAWGQPHG
jgi:hypothetical protein